MEKIRFEIKKEDTEEFCFYLQERENSKATIEKYLRDIRKFFVFIKENEEIGEKENERNIVDKEKILAHKDWLMKHYAVSNGLFQLLVGTFVSRDILKDIFHVNQCKLLRIGCHTEDGQ